MRKSAKNSKLRSNNNKQGQEEEPGGLGPQDTGQPAPKQTGR